MICKFGRAALLLALSFTLSSRLNAAETPAAADATNSAPALLKPGPDAGKIAYVTALMLERLEYMQHPFDPEISVRVFDAYLSALDPQHLHFLQSDITEFAGYRTNLNRFTKPRSGAPVADTRPAYEIFYRYMERLKQHVAYVDELLKTEKFDFTANDKTVLDRRNLPYPKNLDEAKDIWRQRLRYEYLVEKISRETQKTNATASVQNITNASGFATNGTTIIHMENAEPARVLKALQEFQGSNTATAQSVLTTTTNHVEKPGPPKTMREEIVETLGKNNHRGLKVYQDNDSYDVLNRYLESFARAYDPHSDYQGKDEYDDFAMMMNLSLQGIGAVLRSEDGYCQIEELMNGPAKASNKIKVHDRIAAVAQSNQPPVEIYEMPITKAVRLIRGPKGTEVTLWIIPAGAPESSRQPVTLTRDEIKLENGEAKGKIFEVPGSNGTTKRLGMIDLPSFYATIDTSESPTPRSTTADVAALLKKFREENVSGVILDLRRNGGGSLEEAIRLAGLFIKEGPVVQIKHAGPGGVGGEVEVRDDTDPSVAYDGPLVLLTSKFSASASEIVAGALQDYGRALIVGDTTTFGKGTAQQIYYLSKIPAFADATHDPGTLKLTNSKFYRASGASTENRGVAADIILPSLWNDSTEVGETALDNHFDWDTIASSKFEKVNMVQAELPELAKRSNERTATNKEFAYLRADIERVRKQRDEKTVSLNEKKQLADRAQIIADHQQREKERATSKKDEPKVYDLTVAQAGESGLPTPTKKTNDVSAVDGDLDSPIESASNGRDELTEALSAESEHAEAARLQEAKSILLDYISLLNDRTNKPTAPLVVK